MAFTRTTTWAATAVLLAAAALAAAVTPGAAERTCEVKTTRCCYDPHLCGVVTKKDVEVVKVDCLKTMKKQVRAPCGGGGARPTNRLAGAGSGAPAPDADAAAAAVDAAEGAVPAADGNNDSAEAAAASPSARKYTFTGGNKRCVKTVSIAYKARCDKKVFRVTYYPRVCFRKVCTVAVRGRARARRSYVNYQRGVPAGRVGGGGAERYFNRHGF